MLKRSHPFDPLLLAYLAAAWGGGTAAAAMLGLGAYPLALAVAACAGIAALWRRAPRALLYVMALPVLFLLASARYEHTRPHALDDAVAHYNDNGVDHKQMRVRGVLRDDPNIGDTSQRFAITVRAVELRGEWIDASGGVLVSTGLLPHYHSGDMLELEGELKTPASIEGFDYADYLARKNIASTMSFPIARTVGHEDDSIVRATVLRVRRSLSHALALSLPEPQSSLAQGVLLGQRSALPRDLAADLNTTNTSHLVVVSGENVVLVSAYATMLFSFAVGRRRGLALSIAAVVAYTLLIGASPPVLRAMIMGILMVLATISGRRANGITALLVAAAVMIGLNPQTVRDVSFQLSFAATAGILYLASPMRKWLIEMVAALFRSDEVPRWVASLVAEPLAVTLAAIVSTSPLLALNFGRLSLVAIPANVLIVPAFPLILASSLLAGVAGLLPEGRLIFAAPAYYILTYWIVLAHWFASLPHAAVAVDRYSEMWAAATYAAVAVMCYLFLRLGRLPFESRLAESRPVSFRRVSARTAVVLPVALLLGTAGFVFWPSSTPRLHVTVVDVGQGDSILIRTPSGRDILVDGGPGGAVLRGLGDELPWYDRSIELMVLTHPQADHALGLLDVLARYDVRRIIAGPGVERSATYRAWSSAALDEGPPIETAHQGMQFDLGDGVVMDVLGPDDTEAAATEINNTGVVLKITWHEVSFLLTADIQAQAERALLSDGVDLHATVLKVGHHGSATSSTREFLDAVRPSIAAISSGRDNVFGLPNKGVVERLNEYAPVYNTAADGALHFETDGYRLWVPKGPR
ncbi:MAG: DNA internalization-related competence protein ComEC/Rec2 [Chloroflexota bacterium]|nr:DNA internalization-related competence protein ComEC/Rec2 [Chloroflexota bacterium]